MFVAGDYTSPRQAPTPPPTSTSAAHSASGRSRRPRSCGVTEGSPAGRRGAGGCGRSPRSPGLATIVSGFGGGTGVTTYAENIGVMAATKVYSTLLFVVAAIASILLGFSPKFGALILSIPGPVIGGLSIVLFGLIAAMAGRIWVENKVDFSNPRNLITVAAALTAGAGDLTLKFGAFTMGGIGTATFGAIILYQILAWNGASPLTELSGPIIGDVIAAKTLV